MDCRARIVDLTLEAVRQEGNSVSATYTSELANDVAQAVPVTLCAGPAEGAEIVLWIVICALAGHEIHAVPFSLDERRRWVS